MLLWLLATTVLYLAAHHPREAGEGDRVSMPLLPACIPASVEMGHTQPLASRHVWPALANPRPLFGVDPVSLLALPFLPMPAD